MQMISDQERREVARRLREIREDEYGEVYMYDVMLALGIESGKAANWTDKEFIYHLADLIDRPKAKREDAGYFSRCTHCGAFTRVDAVADSVGFVAVPRCGNCGREWE